MGGNKRLRSRSLPSGPSHDIEKIKWTNNLKKIEKNRKEIFNFLRVSQIKDFSISLL